MARQRSGGLAVIAGIVLTMQFGLAGQGGVAPRGLKKYIRK
jgi:hypothetical protein